MKRAEAPMADEDPLDSPGRPVARRAPGATRAGQQVLDLYDEGIAACRKRDPERATRVLMQLIAALDFEYGRGAAEIFQLYDFALREVRAGRFLTVRSMLVLLREGFHPPDREDATGTARRGHGEDRRRTPGWAPRS
jgi:flagellar protein FliS